MRYQINRRLIFFAFVFSRRHHVIGGSRHSNCSILEVIEMCEQIGGKKLNWPYEESHLVGDHIWWISNVYPAGGEVTTRNQQSRHPEIRVMS